MFDGEGPHVPVVLRSSIKVKSLVLFFRPATETKLIAFEVIDLTPKLEDIVHFCAKRHLSRTHPLSRRHVYVQSAVIPLLFGRVIFKDVRANCFCASLLRTQMHTPRHTRARALSNKMRNGRAKGHCYSFA